MSKVAAIYVRVSTVKESQKESPEHQRGICEEKAKVEELDVQFYYEDRSTGTSIVAREDMQHLIDDAKKGYFNTVILSSLSRFARNVNDALNLKELLVDALNIRLISIDEAYDSAVDNDPMKFTLFALMNAKLSQDISLSSRRGIRQSAKRGNYTGSRAPFGYKKVIVDEKKTLQIVPEDAKIVQVIYELYVLHGLGEKRIIELLNEQGTPSPKGGLWGVTTVQRILQNEAYTGIHVFSKHTIKKVYDDLDNLQNRKKRLVQKDKKDWERNEVPFWEAIIEDETFQKAQEIRLLRGGGARGGIRRLSVNAFAGIAKCAHCGSNFVSMKSGKEGKEGQEYRYLICSRRRRIGVSGCENSVWIPYEQFRDELLGEITRYLREAINVEAITEEVKIPTYNNKEENKEKEKAQIEELIKQNRKFLFELRKEMKIGEIDKEQYEFEKQELESTIEENLKKLRSFSSIEKPQIKDEEIRDRIKQGLIELQNLDYKDVKELQIILQQLLDKVEIDKDRNVDIFTPLGKL
ncbi:recombinase family protein [Peribacillus frigoritolerans]|uniref:recombinase family protein n=1 Tax=Peribacillus frigoritolerans TaxID=450367 RepID=UPI002079B34C|nr:recombinase family protein [Peribacillus frigoritolerans]USK78934.1 recombinase family protein [Peribacillus frigoritolerans]